MKRLMPFFSLFLALGCGRELSGPVAVAAHTPSAQAPSHQQEIEKWRADRLARLQREDGWLSLVGLQWLNEGANKIETPTLGGVVTLHKGTVTLAPNPALTIDGKPVATATVLLDDTAEKGPTVVQRGTVRFNAIKRVDRYALRVKDSQAVTRTHFLGLQNFPVSEKWRVDARFEPFHPPRHLAMPNILGITTDEVAPGLLAFTVDGREYKVQPILEQGDTNYFIVFKDATSGKETYGAARFVYAPPADASGHTVIDFNKAYNPPCAFTPFATCPLPPPQNKLPFRVEAGEKNYAGHHSGS